MVEIEFLSSKAAGQKKTKLNSILTAVKLGKIIVLEEPLTRQEEAELISQTMNSIDSKFQGIEIATLGEQDKTIMDSIVQLLGGKTSGLTVVGPAKLVKQIKKHPDKLKLTT